MGADGKESQGGAGEAAGTAGGTGGFEEPNIGEVFIAGGGPGADSNATGANKNVDAPGGDSGPVGEVKRGRGRPPGSATKRKQAEAAVSAAVGDSLRGISELLAFGFKCPELRVSEAEARQFEKHYLEVQKHYPSKINPGHLAIFNLIAVCGLIFVPKVVSISRRVKVERLAKKDAEKNGTKP